MSLPPEVLRIKRKRTDEPIDSLYIESNDEGSTVKRQTQYKDFVFRRQARESSYVKPPPSIPKILATKPGDEKKNGSASTAAQKEQSSKVPVRDPPRVPRRQFHLSRASISATAGKRKIQPESSDDDVAVVIEGPVRRQKVSHQGNRPSQGQDVRQHGKEDSLKRPGVGSRSGLRGGVEHKKTSRAVDSRLQEAMFNYASEIEVSQAKELTSRSTASPKEDTAPDVDMNNGDDAEYVYDTFIRHTTEPSSLGQDGSAQDADRIGFLVIDRDDQELWETFADDEESEKDWDSEQDDENAENYYGADYPEEEVEVEDEYDEDAYRYRRRGGSSDEEFDENDAWSDEGGDAYSAANRSVFNSHSDSWKTPLDHLDH